MFVNREISEPIFIAILQEKIASVAEGSTRETVFLNLVRIIDPYSPARVLEVTCDWTTSPVEGWIGRLPGQTVVIPRALVKVVFACIRLARLAVCHHLDMSERTPRLSFAILGRPDQDRWDGAAETELSGRVSPRSPAVHRNISIKNGASGVAN
jgi:hypothetical protein